MESVDVRVLELSLKRMSEVLDDFIGECMDEDGKTKQPSVQAIMKARGYLPPASKYAFRRK